MKLMKHITIALVLCAIPAMAFGQTVSCDDCTHAVSVYMGGGGLIATAADDAEMVTYVASCGGVTRSDELDVDADGKVVTLFTMANGLACHTAGDNNGFELGPVEDGGWYWITDDMNSAVGNLVSKDVLENDTVDLTNAGDSVTTMMGKGAVFLKEPATGRVGILPNILPEPPVEALRTCGADDKGTTGTDATAVANAANARFVRRTTKCALGDGGTITLATVHNTFSGATTRVPDKGTVVRPSGTGTVVVTVDLWGNHSGHFTTAADGHAQLGQPAVAMGDLRPLTRLTGVGFTARLGSGPTGAPLVSATVAGGITMDDSTANVVTFTIGADPAYCSKTNNESAPVSVTALMSDAASAALVTPPRARHPATGAVGATSFTVVCGSSSSSANQGQELVPENPFPTE